ncbi:C80 family cysteine peptidase, partial [Burkholderia ubonensis]|uniref:C80 family cysteine peptidase n=1 Tax=Burkholderia ubonensis TaxID=101571 RepID=UPI00075AB9D2
KVGGRVTAIDVIDQHDKDGNSGGGNVGIASDGMVNVSLSYGKDDQVHRTAVQHGTIAVRDVQAKGGASENVNRDAGHMSTVTDDRAIAGSKMTVTAGVPLKKLKEALKGKASAETGAAEAGEALGSKPLPAQSAAGDDAQPARVGEPGLAEPAEGTAARRGEDRYAQRVIVQYGEDAVTAQAAQNLANKHPENTVLVKADQQGNLIGLEQLPAGRGKVKVQVVGHGDAAGGTLGDADAPALAKQIGQVQAQLGEAVAVEKVTLVGCKTACETEAGQPSLTAQVRTELAQHGTEVGEVTGRQDYVKVDPDGRKVAATASDRKALGNDKDTLSEPNISENGRQENQVPMKAHYFWDGKNIPEESLRNILLFTSMNPDYDVNVWTSRPGAIFSTLESMRDSGVASSRYLERNYGDYISVKNIGDLYSDLKRNFHRGSEIESIYHREKSGPYRNYAAASDVSRLAILHVEGGLYMDVDVMTSRPVGQLIAPLNFLLHREGGLSSNAVLAATPMAEPTEAMLTQIADSYKNHDIVWTSKRSKIGGFDGRLSGTVAISGPGVQRFIMEPRGRQERKEISVPLNIFGHQRKDGLENIPKEREFSEIFMSNFDPRLDGSGAWEKIRPGRRGSISEVSAGEPNFPSSTTSRK